MEIDKQLVYFYHDIMIYKTSLSPVAIIWQIC